MNRNSVSDHKKEGIEVLELDSPGSDQGPANTDGRGIRLGILGGLVLLVVVAINLLPDPPPVSVDLDVTLPVPAAATTAPASERVSVGVLGTDPFPLRFVPALDGYQALAGPVRFAGLWWMIGNRDEPVVLTSQEGGDEWAESARFPRGLDEALVVSDLIVAEEAMVAVGLLHNFDATELTVWRSADGTSWIPEVVTSGSPFTDVALAANGHNLVVTVKEIDGNQRLFHSSSFLMWEEIPITFSTDNPIVLAPEGGFMMSTSQGAVLTSAFGVNWSRNQAIERGYYTQWNERVIGTYVRSSQLSMRVIAEDGVEVTNLPAELTACGFNGGQIGILAICPADDGNSFDFYLSEDGLIWSKSQSAILSDSLVYIGDTEQGFLVATVGRDGSLAVARLNF